MLSCYYLPMTHRDVIQLWPTQQELADYLGVSRQSVHKMSQRDRINAQYWLKLVDAKPNQITLTDLANHIRVDMQ